METGIKQYSAYQAIDLVREAKRMFRGDAKAALAWLPPPIARAVKRIGWDKFYSSNARIAVKAETHLVGILPRAQAAFVREQEKKRA